jgi:hypothetical protein
MIEPAPITLRADAINVAITLYEMSRVSLAFLVLLLGFGLALDTRGSCIMDGLSLYKDTRIGSFRVMRI